MAVRHWRAITPGDVAVGSRLPNIVRLGRLSRHDQLWLAALAACTLLHATLSTAMPTAAWTTPAGVGGFCLLAMIFSLDQARSQTWLVCWRWLMFSASFLLWAVAWGMLAYLDASVQADFNFAQPDGIASSAKYIPLVLLMASQGGGVTHYMFKLLDLAQGALSVALIALLFSPYWFHFHGAPVSDADDFFYRSILRNAVTGLAIASLFYRNGPDGVDKFRLLLVTLLTSYSIVLPLASNLIIPNSQIPKGSIALLVEDLPFALFMCAAIYLRDRPMPAILRRKPFAQDSLLLAPAGLATFLLLLSFLIGYRDPVCGLWAGLATFALFAVRVGLLQKLYVHSQTERAENERRRADFLAAISHDIRSPLTSVALSAAALTRVQTYGAERTALERRVQAGCEHVVALLSDMLSLSRLAGEPPYPAITRFDPAIVADQAIDLLRPQAVAAGVDLVRTAGIGSGCTPIIGDKDQLRRALVNLITNAIRFTPSGGRVVITNTAMNMGKAQPAVRITIADTGIGIPLEEQPRLLGGPGKVRQPVHGPVGSGLGLQIAREIAIQMGGTLDFESIPNRQTRFWIDVPAAARATLDAKPAASPDGGSDGVSWRASRDRHLLGGCQDR